LKEGGQSVTARLSQRGRKPLIEEYSEQAGILYRAFAQGLSTTEGAVLVNEWRLAQGMRPLSWSAAQHFRLNSKVINTSRRGYKKSGKEEPEEPWCIARLCQCTQFLEQYHDGLLPKRQRKGTYPPLYLDGCIFWDEHHRKIILGK
jgi:hypothetical protein